MITIKHGVKGIQYFSHLISADESRNTQFINGAKKQLALLVFGDFLYLVCGTNSIPMLLG